ncbi:MAG TPA: hypothetical protein O0X39_04230 [Methanocorpusculum sp.]|nr:hypothetical protein [Methanocorpusculum sp.]
MKLKIDGECFADIETGTPVEFAVATRTTDTVRLYDNSVEIASFGGISDISAYVLEGGDWTSAPQTIQEILAQMQADNADRDELIAELLEGE